MLEDAAAAHVVGRDGHEVGPVHRSAAGHQAAGLTHARPLQRVANAARVGEVGPAHPVGEILRERRTPTRVKCVSALGEHPIGDAE